MAHDVIVAGAGPAGSTVGYELAQRGYSVLILEKEVLPRDKLCAGGLPRKVLKFIDLQNGGMVEDRIKQVEFTFQLRERFVLKSATPLLYTVQRRRFDHYLVQRAQSVGCQIMEREPVEGLDHMGNGVQVRTPGGKFRARVLIGADGVSGAVGRLGRFRRRRRIISTLQSEIPMDPEISERYRGRVWIGFGWVPNGYSWIFPKRDSLSVGIGASLRGGRAKILKGAFSRLLRQLFPQHRDAAVSSCPIALGGLKQNLVRGPMLLVGEAASLVHPLTAEGIYYAIMSARLAADAVDDYLSQRSTDLRPYQQRVEQEIGAFFHKSRIFSGIFYGLPRLSFRLFVNNNRHIIRYFGDDVEGPYLDHT